MESFSNLKDAKSPLNSVDSSYILDISGLDFLTIGVGCHCLVALESLDLVEILLKEKCLSIDDLICSKNPLIAKACIQTLVRCKILEIDSDKFYLTKMGKDVCENIGLVTIFFDGYGKLLAKGAEIAEGSADPSSNDFNGKSIAEASRRICEQLIDPCLIKTIAELIQSNETLCDLGCGCASVLEKACNVAMCRGLGFEVQEELLKNNKRVEVRYGDITRLSGEWPEVSIAMQRHVFHDFVTSKGDEILKSYLLTFPNLKYFIYVDFVAPDGIGGAILPGFDYVHSLLGIPTPTHAQTVDMFSRAGFEIVSENSNLGMPNTYLWVLKPKA